MPLAMIFSNPVVALIYIAGAFVVGLLGQNRKFGYWGYFFGSLVLTPVIGLLLVLASDKRKPPVHGISKSGS